jgi:two-component system invasion response regulator UvrY
MGLNTRGLLIDLLSFVNTSLIMIPILILNHQRLVREGWVNYLTAQSGISVIGQTGDPEEAYRIAGGGKPRIVLLSADLIPALLLKQLMRLHEHCSTAGLVLITTSFAEGIQGHLGRLGVRACLSNQSSLDEILTAIVKVNGGKTYTSSALLADPTPSTDIPGYNGVGNLTARELEIATLLTSGKTSKEIADMLNISFRTIEVHRHNILKKTKCKNTIVLANKLSLR